MSMLLLGNTFSKVKNFVQLTTEILKRMNNSIERRSLQCEVLHEKWLVRNGANVVDVLEDR